MAQGITYLIVFALDYFYYFFFFVFLLFFLGPYASGSADFVREVSSKTVRQRPRHVACHHHRPVAGAAGGHRRDRIGDAAGQACFCFRLPAAFAVVIYRLQARKDWSPSPAASHSLLLATCTAQKKAPRLVQSGAHRRRAVFDALLYSNTRCMPTLIPKARESHSAAMWRSSTGAEMRRRAIWDT